MTATAGARSIEYRLLGKGDASVLERVAPEVFDDPVDAAATAAFLADPAHRLVVALDDGLVVGFVSAVVCRHPDEPRPELWINEIAVTASHRRHGIARRLLACLLAAARQAGCGSAWVLADGDNAPAAALYETAGGQPSPGRPVMYNFGIDARERDAGAD
jgi:aminoglycoside 6'-N-acetyltransferase I